jgi:hypothetical protein
MVEDDDDIRFRLAGIDSNLDLETPLKTDSNAVCPRLLKSAGNIGLVEIHVSRIEFAYLLVCMDYMSEHGKNFPAEDDFLLIEGWPVGLVNLGTPPRPEREAGDKLRAKFSCAAL